VPLAASTVGETDTTPLGRCTLSVTTQTASICPLFDTHCNVASWTDARPPKSLRRPDTERDHSESYSRE